ncbi:MAG: hypothetical protein Q9221_002628, partial [Calogaya cf. arnoldii]
ASERQASNENHAQWQRLDEASALETLDTLHQLLAFFYTVITTGTDIVMLLEYAGGELFDYLVKHGKMAEPKARRFFQQIACHKELHPSPLATPPFMAPMNSMDHDRTDPNMPSAFPGGPPPNPPFIFPMQPERATREDASWHEPSETRSPESNSGEFSSRKIGTWRWQNGTKYPDRQHRSTALVSWRWATCANGNQAAKANYYVRYRLKRYVTPHLLAPSQHLCPDANINQYSVINLAGRPIYMFGILGFKVALCWAYLRILKASPNQRYKILIFTVMGGAIIGHVAGTFTGVFRFITLLVLLWNTFGKGKMPVEEERKARTEARPNPVMPHWIQNGSDHLDAISDYRTILGVCITLPIIMTIVVGMRAYTRIKLLESIGIDDWIILFSAICAHKECENRNCTNRDRTKSKVKGKKGNET